MQFFENEDLSKHVTIRIGGIAKDFYIPESREELIQLVHDIHARDEKMYFLSAGSNLLINDRKTFANVIYLGNLDDHIEHQNDDGQFYAGASVRLQKLILTINAEGYGGIENIFFQSRACLEGQFT